MPCADLARDCSSVDGLLFANTQENRSNHEPGCPYALLMYSVVADGADISRCSTQQSEVPLFQSGPGWQISAVCFCWPADKQHSTVTCWLSFVPMGQMVGPGDQQRMCA